ncbi:YhjD/YihY/BrkB family envelope integrity protein [Streptacidiphilus rugosus]|uniref:YhjD/YihY/BrkB family envelope integrity protein n=1 Tax=Streptacidiphilus rugosus TaxID=405783 RepID=UPI001E3820F0|nr:YhjD/YihY/BrkB family envelope integrity protein [Streptacidiphilus rugosus]
MVDTAAWKASLARAKARAQERYDEAQRRLPLLTDLINRLTTENLLDSATRLAAQAFLTTVPLFFAFAAFAPQPVRQQLIESIQNLFGLTGVSKDQLESVLGTGNANAGKELLQTTGVIGLVMALLSATSFSRAMARVCRGAWRLPKATTRISPWRWLAWLIMLLAVFVLQGPVRNGFGAGGWLGFPLGFVLGVAIWWWTQHLLLGGSKVNWLPLLPGAVLGSLCVSVLSVVSHVYMPHALNRTLSSYGSLGLVLALLSWLIVICAAVTFSITIGAVLAQGAPLNRHLGKLARD